MLEAPLLGRRLHGTNPLKRAKGVALVRVADYADMWTGVVAIHVIELTQLFYGRV
jgi:hypothetical protein